MESAVLAMQVLLAVVFAVAAAGKLLDNAGSQRALSGFGVPDRLTRVGAMALPLVELAIAVSLLFEPTARWGALAALALLLGFIAGIANALAHDRAPDCHCFGQLQSAPAGWSTLARNAVLALIAVIVVWRGPGPAIDEWLAARSTAELVVVGAAIALVVGIAVILHISVTRVRDRLPGGSTWLREHSGVALGLPAPDFELAGACDGGLTLEALRRRGPPVMLVFTSSRCGFCELLYSHIARWQAALEGKLTIAVLSVATRAESRRLCEEHRIADVLLAEASIIDTYRLPGTPAAVIVSRDGTVASATVSTQLMIEELMRLAAAGDAASVEPWRTPSPTP